MTTEQTGPGLRDFLAESGSENLLPDLPSFETILDEVCERLEDACQSGYIKRIDKMEKTLDTLNLELEEIILAQTEVSIADTAGQE